MDSVIVAVDGGGSTCRASIADVNGRVLGNAIGRSANLTTDFHKSRENILETVRSAYSAAGLSTDRSAQDYAFFGLAGAGIGGFAKKLEDSLDFRGIRVVTDREITVQGALGDGDGTVALIGTGSFFVGRRNGINRNIGGWGFRLCDDGSAAYLGMELLRRTIQAFDGRIEHSSLTMAILEKFGGTPHGIVEFAQTATPMEFGELAPEITASFDNGDPLAISLISAATKRLETTLDKLDANSSKTLCMLGGLGPFYESQLSHPYQQRCKPPIADAMAGAVQLALNEIVRG